MGDSSPRRWWIQEAPTTELKEGSGPPPEGLPYAYQRPQAALLTLASELDWLIFTDLLALGLVLKFGKRGVPLALHGDLPGTGRVCVTTWCPFVEMGLPKPGFS